MDNKIVMQKIKYLLKSSIEFLLGDKIYQHLRAIKKFIILWIINPFPYSYYKLFKSTRTFTFNGRTYRYFYHLYNTTWENERTIEIPIVREIIQEYRNRTILEVGNVMSHYFVTDHDIIDKYERANGVINQDVVDLIMSKKYDLIISISTLEHVGWDESPREPDKVLRAIDRLKGFLSPGGLLMVTLPLGANPELDKFLREGKITFTEQYFLKRVSRDNKWEQVTWDKVCDSKYGDPYSKANGLIVGIQSN